MQRKAIVFAHADGDGHLAAVQTMENLDKEGIEIIDVVVDPTATGSYRFWEQHFGICELGDADLVVVVDIMFNARNPISSYHALAARVAAEPDRQFVVIDHHPVSQLPASPHNLDIRFVRSVYACCYGDPSELMLLAAICDHDEQPVKARLTDLHKKRAKGVKRAVTDYPGLAGKPTLKLIGDRAWAVFETLADEPAEFHRTMYGRRTKRDSQSPLLQVAHAVRFGT